LGIKEGSRIDKEKANSTNKKEDNSDTESQSSNTYNFLNSSLNKIFAKVFANLISFLHVLVVLAFFNLIFTALNERVVIPFTGLYLNLYEFGDRFLFAVILIIFYTLIMGTLTTLISINENLSDINKKINSFKEKQE
jgi:ABC-type multidrug transport system fused ATPase/permease subunit